MPFPGEALELARLRALGQLPPTVDPATGKPIDYEGPADYVDPAEQSQLMSHGFGTKVASRIGDAISSETPPPPPAPAPQSAEQGPNRGPEGPAAIAASGPAGPGVAWTSNDPAALAEAARSQKDAAAEASLAHSTGQLIRLVGSAIAGGAAGGAVGAGAGAASGTGAGASSGAGFGDSYWAGLGQGGGTGAGGFLGRLSSGLLTGKTTGVEQDPTARLLATLYGMA